MKQKLIIYAISDATGELATKLSENALRQFPSHQVQVIRVPHVNNEIILKKYVQQAQKICGLIAFTFVSEEMRENILKLANEYHVVVIDVLGPMLVALSTYLHETPSSEPGQQYKLTQDYFRRTEAVEFTVKHDDGLGLDTINKADVILLGVSRTSKTPLSIFMAYRGYRCANIPVVNSIPLPKLVSKVDVKKIVGLTISARKLMSIRSARLEKLGRPPSEDYAQMTPIRQELEYANKLFAKLEIPVIDVTGKAIEETATDIIKMLKL